MLNLLVAMFTIKGTWILFLLAPWLLALILFSQGGVPGKTNWGSYQADVVGCGPCGRPPRFQAQASGGHKGRTLHEMELALAPSPTPEPKVIVDLPQGGEALQGVVSINGTTDVPGFRSAEVDFAYQSNPTGTWFLIQQSSAPAKDGMLASWDTTTIADGEYRLRVQVFLQGGQVMETVVDGLRVRNYTNVETSTPEARPMGQATPTPTATPRPDFQVKTVAATPLPTNPAELTPRHLEASALYGVMAVLGVSIAAVLYLGLRSIFRR